jgi:hypothetical protein
MYSASSPAATASSPAAGCWAQLEGPILSWCYYSTQIGFTVNTQQAKRSSSRQTSHATASNSSPRAADVEHDSQTGRRKDQNVPTPAPVAHL